MAPMVDDSLREMTEDVSGYVMQKRGSVAHRMVEMRSPQAPCTITNLFEHQVLLHPFDAAVEFEHQPFVSYSRLKLLSNRIADALPVQPGMIVPICVDLGVELIASILGVLASGAAYVILDPAGSLERNRYIVDEVKADVVITSAKYASLYPGAVAVEGLLDEVSSRRRNSVQDNRRHSGSFAREMQYFEPTSPAYTIFTSGTTGKPKGVVISHAAASYGISHFSLTGKSRWLLFFNPVFSAAQRTILATLCKGGCVCLTTKERLVFSLPDVIRSMEIDSLGVTPSMLATLSPNDVPSSLKQITTVGEPVSSSVLNAWTDKVEFKISYGLSECAQLNFSRRVIKGDNPTLVGKPTDTTEAYVLFPDTNEVADVGEAGELCLVGPQLSDGYLNRPIETAKAFVLNPFGPGRMFRTGDLAVEHDDGKFEILGRIDFQIKLNGQRIEPEEVSATLNTHAAVRATSVVAANIGDSKALIAAVVSHSETDWNSLIEELRAKTQDLLPAYMVPSYWLRYDALPTNANGKVDIRQIQYRAQNTAISEMISFARKPEEPTESITDAVELAIQAAWADILSLEPHMVGRHDSFLELGGNSMQAIRMVNRLRSAGIDLGLDALFQHEDLASLRSTATIQEVDQISRSDTLPFSMISDDTIAVSLKAERGVVDAYPATPLQESLVGLTLQGSTDYLYQRVWDVKSLDLIRLKLAFRIAFLQSETLRTTFDWTDSGLIQLVRDDLPFQWQMLDMSLEEYKKKDRDAGVALGLPFFRVAILNGSVLVVSMHHSLFDFWSSTFLYEDVAALYQGLEPSPRPAFKAFVQQIFEIDSRDSEIFWSTYLSQATPTILNNAPQAELVSVKRTAVNLLDQISTACNVTSSTILNFCWAFILSKHLDSNDVTLANTLSGREMFVEGIDRLDGPTLTVVPRRFQFEPTSTVQQLLSNAHRESSQVLKHSQFGMRNALKAGGHSGALFDTMINILPPSNSRSNNLMDSVFKRLGEKPSWQTEYTTLEIELERDEIHVTLNTTMEKMRAEFILEQLIQLLIRLSQETTSTVKDLSIITMAEVEMLDVSKEYPTTLPQLLHQDFEKHVRTTPWRVALQWQNEEVLTYRMLDQRANKLARYFQKQGLKRGDFACMLIEKSPMMIVTILATLKLGVAYIPLSPENPIDRNLFIIEQAGARAVLTERSVEQAGQYQNVDVIYLDELNVTKFSNAPLNTQLSANDIAYVVFTSGSTGTPKGCVINHGAAAAGIESMIKAEGRHQGEWRALQFSNYTFDASVLDIFNTLNSGGTLCMAPNDRLLSDLAGVIDEMDVTHSFLTPTVARLIQSNEAPSLVTASLGGEPLTDDVLKTMADRRVIQCYGPTETSMVVTMRNMSAGENPRNLGKPFDTVQVFIVERDSSDLVPYGAIGELCIAGPQVGVGYMKRPDLTAAAFTETSLGGAGRMYRSGDLARWLPGGELECLGRKDNQVKINGHRIELGEIENAILATRLVNQCVTIVAQIGSQKQLASFVVFADHNSDEESIQDPDSFYEDVANLRSKLNGLATYMYPKVLLPLGSMPKLPSGKSNRKLLAAWFKEIDSSKLQSYNFESFGSSSGTEMIACETEQQMFLEEAFKKVLNVEKSRVGQEGNFLSLGGDSISAINLSGFVRKQGQILSVGDILKFPRLKDMAEHVRRNDDEQVEIRKFETPDLSIEFERSGLSMGQVDHIYPCPPGQAEFLLQGKKKEQFWALMTVRPLNTPSGKWIRAVEKLTETEEILRTTFIEVNGQWIGVVLKSSTIIADFIDVADEAEKKAAVDSIWHSRFSFGKPFVRYAFLCYPDGKQEVVTKMDHGLYDGTLLRVFASHFKELQHGRPVPEFTPFKDFSHHLWQSNKTSALKFWTNDSNRPTGFQFPIVPSGLTPSAIKPVFVPFDHRLDDFANVCGVTVPTIFQAAFQLWMAKSTGKLDIGFDYLYTGRNVDMPDPEQINGTCANFIPLRSKVKLNGTVKDYLIDTQDFFWNATDNGNVGMSEIYDANKLDRSLQGNRALFLFQPFEPAPVGAAKDGKLSDDMRWVYMAGSEVKMEQPYALVTEVHKTATGFKLKVTADPRIMSREEATTAAAEVLEIARKMAMDGTERSAVQMAMYDFETMF